MRGKDTSLLSSSSRKDHSSLSKPGPVHRFTWKGRLIPSVPLEGVQGKARPRSESDHQMAETPNPPSPL